MRENNANKYLSSNKEINCQVMCCAYLQAGTMLFVEATGRAFGRFSFTDKYEMNLNI